MACATGTCKSDSVFFFAVNFRSVLGLYKTTAWPPALVKKIVITRKIAPFFPPVEEISDDPTVEECPLCMMYYPGGLNRALCCRKVSKRSFVIIRIR